MRQVPEDGTACIFSTWVQIKSEDDYQVIDMIFTPQMFGAGGIRPGYGLVVVGITGVIAPAHCRIKGIDW